MQKLRLAGIHDDGENLVLESSDGITYLLPIDQNLRQSIARARRISPLRGGNPSGVFGPRDIQTRFRQGATVEEIARESGWEPERVRRYEWPIVAERANIIQTARTVVISPAPGQGGVAQSLNQHIETISERYGFAQATMDWSTWQQESSQWTVSLDIELSEQAQANLPRGVAFPARWNFNPANQSIYASNEAAYFLMGRDHSHDAPIPGPAKQAAAPQQEASEEENQQDAHSDSGIQAAEPRIARVTIPEQKEQNELLDELNARRGVRSFDPASERKLADLLERARRSSRPTSPAGAETESAPDIAEAANPVADKAPEQAQVSNHDALAQQTSVDAQQVATANTPSAQVEESPLDTDGPATPEDLPGQNRASQATETEEVAVSETQAQLGRAQAPQTSDQAQSFIAAQDTVASQEDEESRGAEASQGTDISQNASSSPTEVADESSEGQQAKEQGSRTQQAGQQPNQHAKSSRAKRTSVPSWDDIIFGNQRR